MVVTQKETYLDTPYRVLGETGERVSAIGLGGRRLGLPHVGEQLSIEWFALQSTRA